MDALLITDVQTGLFTDAAKPLHDGEAVVTRIAALIAAARAASRPVIYIQHDGGAGDPLARGEPGFALRPEIAPQEGDPVVVKRFANAFQETELAHLLATRNIARITLCGLRTEFCIDATCRTGCERGFEMTLVGDAHTTFDNGVLPADMIVRHHNVTLGQAFATVVPADAVRFGA